MYRKILVAIDGSPTAQLALNEAIELAKALGSTLRLIHVVDEGPAYLNVETTFQLEKFEQALRLAGQAVIDNAIAVVRAAGLNAESKIVEIVTLSDRVAGAVANEAEHWSADLIVIGTHGRRGFHHLILGSVAEGVIRIVTKPVLLIRGQ